MFTQQDLSIERPTYSMSIAAQQLYQAVVSRCKLFAGWGVCKSMAQSHAHSDTWDKVVWGGCAGEAAAWGG